LKKVERYKCDYCEKVKAKPETMERHEKQCIKNPNCFNCYMCEHAYVGEHDQYYSDDCTASYKEVPQCVYYEETLQPCYGGIGNIASKCDKYKRSDKICYDRNYDEAVANYERNKVVVT
jgi:hypothetical protein